LRGAAEDIAPPGNFKVDKTGHHDSHF
jgi:hypothetical protein